MNPAQYKRAMRERALGRQAEIDRLRQRELNTRSASLPSQARTAYPPARSLSSTYPSSKASMPKNESGASSNLAGSEREEGENSSATSIASSAGGGLEGFEVSHVATISEESSPATSRPPSGPWSSSPQPTQVTGFDKQGGIFGSGAGSDDDDDCEDSLGFPTLRGRGVRTLQWGRRPGETSISQSIRLYLFHRDPDASHEENCALVLGQILERVAMEELDVRTLRMRHIIKLEAFLRSVVLSVPTKSWRQSFKGAFSRTAPASSRRGSKSSGHGQQILKEELGFRLSLFVSMMKAEREGEEADVKVDAVRVESVLRGYIANAAEILPLQRPARTLLPPLLFCMACEMLGVRLLAPEVRDVCRQIVTDYEARAKLWMSPAQNAERYLRPLVTEFASWMRSNRDVLYQGSATEGLLRSMDEDLRTSLKRQVYISPKHFLSVIKSLAPELTDMHLPSYDPSGGDDDHPFDVSQTLKDVSRERFDVNGVPTEPCDCWHEIRALLLKPLGAAEATKGGGGARAARAKASGGGPSAGGANPSQPRPQSAACADAAAGDKASGRGCWERGGSWKSGLPTDGYNASKTPAERYVDQCSWRVLHAASRTASGGDCFFVVQDLFGGDGVLVKMATAATERIKICTRGRAVRVTTVDKYDIYHSRDVDMSRADAPPLPLMTIITTMKEVIQFVPYSGTLARRKSMLVAEEPGSISPEESANMQPSHATSTRFITIAAALPDYPDDHLNASAGVLAAPPSAPAVTEQAPPRVQESASKNGSPSLSALRIRAGDSIPPACRPEATSTLAKAGSVHRLSSLQRRPSSFNSPPPAAVERKKRAGLDRDSGNRSVREFTANGGGGGGLNARLGEERGTCSDSDI